MSTDQQASVLFPAGFGDTGWIDTMLLGGNPQLNGQVGMASVVVNVSGTLAVSGPNVTALLQLVVSSELSGPCPPSALLSDPKSPSWTDDFGFSHSRSTVHYRYAVRVPGPSDAPGDDVFANVVRQQHVDRKFSCELGSLGWNPERHGWGYAALRFHRDRRHRHRLGPALWCRPRSNSVARPASHHGSRGTGVHKAFHSLKTRTHPPTWLGVSSSPRVGGQGTTTEEPRRIEIRRRLGAEERRRQRARAPVERDRFMNNPG